MKNKVFKSIFSVALCALLITLLLTTLTLHSYFVEIQDRYLHSELDIASQGVIADGEDFLEHFTNATYRLTWISTQGEIIYDTQSDINLMDNHSDREEFLEAINTGRGSSVRYSNTMTEKTIYEAKLLSDGTVLRASISRATVWDIFFKMIPYLLFVGIIIVCLSYFAGRRMAQKVVEPLNHLNLDAPMSNEIYDEITPLLHRIDAQHKEIQRQLSDLRKKQDEFEQITGSIQECLVLLDNSGRVVGINSAAKKLFHEGDSCIGAFFSALDSMKELQTHVDNAKIHGHDAFRVDIDDHIYQFELSRVNSDEKTVGVVILSFDITNQVRSEILRQDFAANVSHELKTPLQGIIGSAELIESGMIGVEDMPRFVSHIRTEAARLVMLIEDIIRLSHLDDGVDLPRESVSLKSLAEDVIDALSDAAEKKQISVSVEGANGVIQGVPSLIYEIIYNLCDNAIKYNFDGGRVDISINEGDDKVFLAVSDTGIGISPDQHDKVFERFYRVDKSRSKHSGGTGLGLSIVKHAVACHDGRLTIESCPNEGTTIQAEFPKS